MKRLRLFCCALCALFAFSLSVSATDYYGLYLAGLDGGYTDLRYSTLRSLTFSQVREDGKTINRMTVNAVDGTSVDYDLANADYIFFEDVTVGIGDVTEENRDEAPFSCESASGSVTARETGVARVCLPDGRMVQSRQVAPGDKVSLDGLCGGIYILNLNGKSIKILKR